MKPAIRVENLSKRYRIGTRSRDANRNLTEAIMDGATAVWRGLTARGRCGDAADAFWALKDVSFDVQPGEVVGIIGHNGAGKSTLLKILSRIAEPTSGRAVVRGRMASLLEVGTGFHPELTGRENIYLNGSLLGMSRKEIDQKFDEIVVFSEIEPFLDTPVKRYSSGMYVRLAFAVAAHLDPDVLVIDEVLAVGDASFQKKCLGKIGNVAQEGRTVLFVTHNMGSVLALCRNVVWVHHGQLRSVGPSRTIIQRYLGLDQQQGKTSLDLNCAVRSGDYGAQLKVLGVEWLSGLPLRNGEPIRARIRVAASSFVEDVSIGLGFSSLEGIRILSYDSDFSGPRRQLEAGEQATVDVVLPELPLAPGLYLLDVGARSDERCGLDYLSGCSRIEVIPGDRTPSMITSFPNSGVRVSGHWDWHSPPSSEAPGT
jgi:lipopolysaccharide transport system ATP-binding protein